MLKAAYNELELTVRLRGHSALLVKDGRYTDEIKKRWTLGKDAPHAMFMVRESLENVKNAFEAAQPRYTSLTYFIPGSSLKGALRAHLERVLRGKAAPDEPRVCDPLDKHSCSKVLAPQGKEHAAFPYRGACPICRLFGHTSQAGRIRFSDADRKGGSPRIVHNVSISRQTGSVLDPHFSLAIVDADFEFKALLRNFELWHLGLLGALFTDMAARRVPLGSAKSRGFGDVSATVSAARLTYLGAAAKRQDLAGIGEVAPADAPKYGFAPARTDLTTLSTIRVAGDRGEQLPWRSSYALDPAKLWFAAIPYFSDDWWKDHSGLLSDRAQRGAPPLAEAVE